MHLLSFTCSLRWNLSSLTWSPFSTYDDGFSSQQVLYVKKFLFVRFYSFKMCLIGEKFICNKINYKYAVWGSLKNEYTPPKTHLEYFHFLKTFPYSFFSHSLSAPSVLKTVYLFSTILDLFFENFIYVEASSGHMQSFLSRLFPLA